MATFISDNQKFHIFSKSPVRANMELFQATNKSGHTIISEEVRTDDIPWFINVPDVNNPPSYVKDPRKNDIIFQGKFNSLSTAAICKTWDGEKWVDGPNLKENPILKNENDDNVIQVHFENNIEYVSDTNNAGTTSDKQAAFVLKTNGEMLTHFVSPTDKIYNGIPSNGYGLYLFLDNQLQSETDSNDNGYIANSYAGIIQFNKARSEGANKFKVITFEYIGGYLSKSLNKIGDDLKDYIDEEIKEHNKEFIAHKNNQNSEKHLSQSEVDGLNTLTSADKISGIETATQYDYNVEADLSKVLSSQISTPNTSDNTFKNVTIKLHLRDKVLQQSTMPVTSKAIYNHVHKQSVNIEKASDNVAVEEVTTNENERRKYTIAVDGYTTLETDNIVDDIYEKIQTTADDINKNVAEHTSNNGIHITDTERVSWNNNEVILQKHLNDQNSHVSDEDREKWATKDNLSSHISNNVIHITADEREKWNKGGNMAISGDNFITSEKTDTGWNLTLNNSTVVGSSIISNIDGNKKVPTVNAVTNRVNDAITLHERTKNHLDFNKISFALSGGHLINEISNEIKESPKYIFEYTEDETINPSEINYTGLIVNNKSLKGLNAFFKKLIIKKVQPINASNLYAHITRSAEKVVSSGLLQNKEYILTLKADITTPNEITLNFGNKLIISKEYWYGIEFTESEAIPSTTSPEVILNYNNFANVNYDPTAQGPSYPSLVTNKVLENTEIADITYNIPCIMEFEDYEIPTSNAVINYVDNAVDEHKKDTIGTELSTWDIETTFTDGATNVFDFTCNSPFTGILTEVRLYCSPKTAAGEESYLEIRQNDKILARSTTAQYHSTNNLLKFNFDNILLKLGDRYGFYIVDKNGSKPSTSCLALNTKNNVPEVANLNVVVSNYSNHTPRFGFTYYKSNREMISNTLNKLNSDLVYDISYKYSNLNNITNVTNRTITFADNSKIDFPISKITHGKYAFRTKSNTTSPLTEFNLRIIDGGKPGAHYDSAYYYERDVRNSSYDEDVGGNLETLGNLINGDGMFIRAGITVFNDDLSCLIRARQMFTNSSLTTFRSALPSLTFADRMFLGTKLTEFKIKLPNLSSAECMFRLCKNLEFVDTCLPNLTFAQGMFGYCIALNRIDLSPSSGANLYLADNMFTGCESLTSVKLNLEYLENAKDMFASGVYNGVTYNAPLLDLSSVINIANTIKDWTNDYYTNKVHEIAIGINETSEIYNSGNSSYKQYIDQIADKNWKVSLYTSNSRQSPAFTIVKD